MSRAEYMTELETLLRDMPQEERNEALQYYNDYFDEAGVENESRVISELGSAQALADTIMAGTPVEEEGEFRETGYTDTRFEQRETPAQRGAVEKSHRTTGEPKSNNTLKIVLIVLIVIVGAPIVLPVAVGLLSAAVGIIAALFGVFIAVAMAGFSMAVGGITAFVMGIGQCFHSPALGLGMIGIGLLLTAVGIILGVFMVKLVIMIIPPIIRGIINLCRRLFHRKGVKA